MKSVFNFTKPLVQGDEHEITKNEIKVVPQPDGSYDLQERDTNGNLKSLVKGGAVADVKSPIYNFNNRPSEVIKAIDHFIEVGTEEGYVESRIFITEVDIIRKLLPESKDIHYTPSNLIGYVGCKTDDGGFELATVDWYLKVKVDRASITVYKFDATE